MDFGAGTYAFINNGSLLSQPNNTGLIHCCIIYEPAVLTP